MIQMMIMMMTIMMIKMMTIMMMIMMIMMIMTSNLVMITTMMMMSKVFLALVRIITLPFNHCFIELKALRAFLNKKTAENATMIDCRQIKQQ